MDIMLTKDSDALICLLYKHYCQQIKDGVPKVDAKMFGGSDEIHATVAPKWTFGNVDEACFELSRAGVLSCRSFDNRAEFVQLSDLGIVYMENRFKNGLSDVLDYLGKIRNILPI